MFSSIIRSTSLYLQYLVVFTQIAAGCQPAATWVNTTRYCKYSQVHVFVIILKSFARNKEVLLGEICLRIKYWASVNKFHTDSNG